MKTIQKQPDQLACIEPGFVLTSINNNPVTDWSFALVLEQIKKTPRPIALGFTHADTETSQKYRHFKYNSVQTILIDPYHLA